MFCKHRILTDGTDIQIRTVASDNCFLCSEKESQLNLGPDIREWIGVRRIFNWISLTPPGLVPGERHSSTLSSWPIVHSARSIKSRSWDLVACLGRKTTLEFHISLKTRGTGSLHPSTHQLIAGPPVPQNTKYKVQSARNSIVPQPNYHTAPCRNIDLSLSHPVPNQTLSGSCILAMGRNGHTPGEAWRNHVLGLLIICLLPLLSRFSIIVQ
ncbi:hypothetical protein DL95DRAFT_12553 [Leptodontidium sp. 2 PMI_412]|nr:hypothetical protein DL95DRAFT_12553 [Leptodontidium sp. 2 PMI_412]